MLNYPQEIKEKVSYLERANQHFDKNGQKGVNLFSPFFPPLTISSKRIPHKAKAMR